MRWEVTTTATSLECRTLRRWSPAPNERAFFVETETVLTIARASDDEVTAARTRKAVARAIARHVAVTHASPVEMLMNGAAS